MAGFEELTVSADGTVFFARHLATAADGQFDVVAVRPSGVIGWTYTFTSLGPASLELSGTNVVAVQRGLGLGQNGQTPVTGTTPTSKLTALSQASGAVIWQLDVDGNVMEVEAANGVLYLTVVKPAVDATGQMTPGTGLGDKNLVAVSADGAVLWTLKLN